MKVTSTIMHSSRMRTGRWWTVCWSQHPGGGLPGPGGGSARSQGGVLPGPGGWWCLAGPGGVSAWPQGGDDIPACTEADTLPPCGQTDTCKNITLATTSLRPVITLQPAKY